MELVSRKASREHGLLRYFTGAACKNGHLSERWVAGGHCIECVNAAQVAWRERLGPDGLKAAQKIYDLRFKEKNPARKYENSKLAAKKVLERDPEHYRNHAKRWRKENPEAFKVICKRAVQKFRRENPLAAKIRDAATRATYRAKSSGVLSPKGLSLIVRRVWDRSNGRCAACPATDNLQLDHIVAIANGGTNDEVNLQFLCGPCNSSKGTRDHDEWLNSHSYKELPNAA